MTNRVDTAVNHMKPPCRDATVDRTRREIETFQLPPRHHPVLSQSERRDPMVPRPPARHLWARLTSTIGVNLAHTLLRVGG
jgi:hypothetical protein